MISRIAVLLTLIATAGCAAGNCDPQQAGFITGIAGEMSGCYAKRDEALRSQLAANRLNLQQQMDTRQAAHADADAAIAQRDQAMARLNSIRGDTEALRRRLLAAQRREGVDRAAVDRQLAEVARLERDRSAAAAAPRVDPAVVQDLDQRRRALLDLSTSY